ncbi:unnamed protein product [Protopolystoma xenopodis]|uniref:Uncharacterized protein n=1 Tax=Protopolystoma xenopodis TaxID=117903 RepID=A0A448WM38_9PLAT|nr:unnamed protein product [Protopolystoma xenopodis]
MAAGTINGTVMLCDLETGHVQPLDGHAMPVRSLSFSADGRLLASASDDKQIRIYDVHDGRLVVPRLTGHAGWVVSVEFPPSGQTLVSASTDKTVRVWNISNSTEVHAFREHEDQVCLGLY